MDGAVSGDGEHVPVPDLGGGHGVCGEPDNREAAGEAMTRLLAYLTEDVVRISPRWVAWLETVLIFMAMVQAVRILFK